MNIPDFHTKPETTINIDKCGCKLVFGEDEDDNFYHDADSTRYFEIWQKDDFLLSNTMNLIIGQIDGKAQKP